MAATGIDPFLIEATVFLGAAVVAVPLFKRLRLGSVIGYLAAGAAIGPYGGGLIEDVNSVLHFAEFGVVLLLFVIGLELQPARLWRLRTEIFGLGLSQVLLTACVITAAIYASGWLSLNAAMATGGALALSSTAFAIQILRERGDLNKPYGDRAFSILLFQDLAIVPLLAFVSLLSPWSQGIGDSVVEQIAVAIAAMAGLIIVGHFGLPRLFRIIAITRSDEIFTAAALLVVVGSAVAMQYAGLSMALGAFLAGVLLAESEFRHQLETDIEPFRGLLLGLLFMAIGMSVDWSLVITNWDIVIFGALALVIIKAAILASLAMVFRSSWRDALRIAASLSQGGEFGFVLFTVSISGGLLTQSEAFILNAIVTATMALTPLAMLLVDRAVAPRAHDPSGMEVVEEAEIGAVIVVGFGRFGQVIARILRLRGYDVTMIDSSPDRIRIARTFGNKVFFGDARRADILRIAGAEQARAVFICTDDPPSVLQAVKALKARYPNLLVFARAHDRVSKLELTAAGADVVMREMFESSVAMAKAALDRMNDGDIAEEIIDEFRRRDAEFLRLQSTFGAEKGYEEMREKFDLSPDAKQ